MSSDKTSDIFSRLKYAAGLEKIIHQMKGIMTKNRKEPCSLNNNNIDNFTSYLNTMDIELTSEDQTSIKTPTILILIPTIIPTDIARTEVLIENINTYMKYDGSKILLFFNFVEGETEITSYFDMYFGKYKNRVGYVLYSHKPISTKSHVGFARAAIAYYLLGISGDQIVIISDDRRVLRVPENKKVHNLNSLEYKEIIDNIIDMRSYVTDTKNTIISPVGERITKFGTKTFADTDDYIMAQIFMGMAKTFINIYICTSENTECHFTREGYKTTTNIESCFSRLFEDCSFVNAGYDNGFNMKVYTRLIRKTKDVKTVARSTKKLSDLDPDDRENVCSATRNCLVHKKDDTYLVRWGNHYDRIGPKFENDDSLKDGYEYHRSMIDECLHEEEAPVYTKETDTEEFVVDNLVCINKKGEVKVHWKDSWIDLFVYNQFQNEIVKVIKKKKIGGNDRFLVQWKDSYQDESVIDAVRFKNRLKRLKDSNSFCKDIPEKEEEEELQILAKKYKDGEFKGQVYFIDSKTNTSFLLDIKNRKVSYKVVNGKKAILTDHDIARLRDYQLTT